MSGQNQRQLLFVYGTLMKGHCRHAHLADQQFVAMAKTSPEYKLYHLGNYPGLVEVQAGGNSISGELWSVDSARLEKLDIVEGVNENLYERRTIRLRFPSDVTDVESYFYLGSVDGKPDLGDCWTVAESDRQLNRGDHQNSG